ncbi:MAG: hypothetical protein U0Q11_17710 [Vicinamibacterales bacterium]
MTLYPSRYRILASLGFTAALMSAPALVTSAAAESVTLSGCLVKADGDLDPYLLINAPAQPALNQTPAADVNPTGVGTAAEFRTIFYWLKGNGESGTASRLKAIWKDRRKASSARNARTSGRKSR